MAEGVIPSWFDILRIREASASIAGSAYVGPTGLNPTYIVSISNVESPNFHPELQRSL